MPVGAVASLLNHQAPDHQVLESPFPQGSPTRSWGPGFASRRSDW
jgi:hypothetical protein